MCEFWGRGWFFSDTLFVYEDFYIQLYVYLTFVYQDLEKCLSLITSKYDDYTQLVFMWTPVMILSDLMSKFFHSFCS